MLMPSTTNTRLAVSNGTIGSLMPKELGEGEGLPNIEESLLPSGGVSEEEVEQLVDHKEYEHAFVSRAKLARTPLAGEQRGGAKG
jgi:hypothetical protein